jgi:hypothetical protein
MYWKNAMYIQNGSITDCKVYFFHYKMFFVNVWFLLSFTTKMVPYIMFYNAAKQSYVTDTKKQEQSEPATFSMLS